MPPRLVSIRTLRTRVHLGCRSQQRRLLHRINLNLDPLAGLNIADRHPMECKIARVCRVLPIRQNRHDRQNDGHPNCCSTHRRVPARLFSLLTTSQKIGFNSTYSRISHSIVAAIEPKGSRPGTPPRNIKIISVYISDSYMNFAQKTLFPKKVKSRPHCSHVAPSKQTHAETELAGWEPRRAAEPDGA